LQSSHDTAHVQALASSTAKITVALHATLTSGFLPQQAQLLLLLPRTVVAASLLAASLLLLLPLQPFNARSLSSFKPPASTLHNT
jgi:hypothetical protein